MVFTFLDLTASNAFLIVRISLQNYIGMICTVMTEYIAIFFYPLELKIKAIHVREMYL